LASYLSHAVTQTATNKIARKRYARLVFWNKLIIVFLLNSEANAIALCRISQQAHLTDARQNTRNDAAALTGSVIVHT